MILRFRICLLFWPVGISSAAEPSHAALDERHRIFFQDNCTKCHNADKQKGKVRLDDIPFTMDTIQQADLWQKVLDSINAGDMPPEDEKQPDAAAKTDFLADLSLTMVAARARLSDSGGKSAMRRLNRREYQNTIRDLLGVELDVSGLPADSTSGTFDTVGASLFMSSDQFEQYLALGRHALDEHFLKAATPASSGQPILRLEPETEANPVIDGTIHDWTQTEAKFKLWAAEVERAAMSPENAQAMAEIMTRDPHVRMPPAENNFMLYYHSEQIKGAPQPQDHGLGDPHHAAFLNQLRIDYFPLYRHFAALPHRQHGAYLMTAGGYSRIDIKPPTPLPAGNYTLRLRLGATQESPLHRRFLEVGPPDPADGYNWDLSKAWSTHQVTSTIENPQILEVPIQLKSNEPQVISIRERQPRGVDVRNNFYYVSKAKNGYGPDPVIWVDWVELIGSNMPASEQNPEIVQLSNTKNLDEHSYAKECFNILAARAFRGKTPSQEFFDKLFAIYQTRRSDGVVHQEALNEALSVVLASPGFLYLQEIGSSPAPSADAAESALSAVELASRLSYFLWSAPPDAMLSGLAASGELLIPEVLSREVDRMIDSPKCDEFIEGFMHQWLGLARLDFFQFNTMHFRDFDESAKVAARREVYETFAHLLRGNGSLNRLLKSDEIHVNSLLATFYGIEGVYGDAFQKVKLPANSPRGGLLGMAAILAMGSNGERTSPVERGAWVLRHLLHNPPPPAPPNVPQLSRLEGKPLSPRERVAAHMEEPQCASCHRKIDPIGFGLENFDAVGKWREIDHDLRTNQQWPIDPAGSFHNGPAFKDYFELRDHIAAKSDDFAQGFTEGLIEYALGRPYGFTDASLAAGIIDKAKAKDFAVREFIQALVLSREFGLK